MGDVGDEFRERELFFRARKNTRASENMAYLGEHGVAWEWVDEGCDHILIDGRTDYYLGKTYWFDRKTRKRGYAMLHRLLGGEAR